MDTLMHTYGVIESIESIEMDTHTHTQELRVRAKGLGRWLRALPDEALVHTLLPCLDGADLARCVGWAGWGD